MLVAVLSDIHSNVFALQAVLRDLEPLGVSEIWLAGDTFGYYPWAAESFRALDGVQPVGVLGNHDSWVAHAESAPPDIAGEIARHNAGELAAHGPAALDWLGSLSPDRSFERNGWRITIAHGTPENPLEGRYYPDDTRPYRWLPQPDQILILGQTHYPIMRGDARSGLVLNPGSVGQPRDGNPMPSWALLDLATGSAELRRTVYDNAAVIGHLRCLEWDDRLIRALDERRQRP
jgi:predicted phosphodiesterase